MRKKTFQDLEPMGKELKSTSMEYIDFQQLKIHELQLGVPAKKDLKMTLDTKELFQVLEITIQVIK